jgi:hypothetical protein
MSKDESLKQALEAAYLAGFRASSEGNNAEYGVTEPESNRAWILGRDEFIKEALAAPVQPEHISPKQLLALAQEANLGLDKVLEVFRMAAQPAPVFCEHCGGNDEDPQDHCMDCTRPRWEPVTQELLNNQHPWLYEPMWIASKDGSVCTGIYEWQQGRNPDRFITEDGDGWAFDFAYVMPMIKPTPPAIEAAHGITKGQP